MVHVKNIKQLKIETNKRGSEIVKQLRRKRQCHLRTVIEGAKQIKVSYSERQPKFREPRWTDIAICQ